VTCTVEGCGRCHHTLLHGAEKVVKKDDSRKKKEESKDSINAIISDLQNYTTLLQLVPVTVRAKNGKPEDVVAFLNGESTGTIISEDLAVLLGQHRRKNLEKTSGHSYALWVGGIRAGAHC